LKDFTEGNITKSIFFFAVPMLISNVFHQLYNLIDSAIVGKFIGTEALAAVGASFPVIFVIISLLLGVAMGINIIVSQYFGAKEYKNVSKAITTFYIFIVIAAIIMSAIGIYFSRDIFELLKLPEEVMDDALTYLKIYLGGMVFSFLFYGTNAILRGLGDAKTPLYFVIMSTLLNIALDLIFVLVLGWGIAGVAWATVISQAVTVVIAIFYVYKREELFDLRRKSIVFDWEIFYKSIRIGLPSGLQQSFVALGMIAIIRIVNDFGTTTLAAYNAAGRLDAFASMPAMAIASALGTFVGQNIGANKIERVRVGYISTMIFTSLIAVSVTIVMFFFGKSLMGIFTNDQEVIEIGYSYLVIVSSFYVFFAIMFTNNGVLRGAGDTVIPMFITLIALWLLRIPLSYTLSRPWTNLGSDGIWWGIPIAWGFGAIASYVYYRSGRWKTKKVTSN
jgi:putative MATE family efflux protein